VLPSEREAFGQVLVESLAAGTPVVGTEGAGAEKILANHEVAVMAERPDPESLALALGRGLELSRSPAVSNACKRHAERWDWTVVGPRFERLYAHVIAGRPGVLP